MRRATPFVWLAGQAHDHRAGFATLRGASLRREDEGCNRWVLARGRFAAQAGPAEIALTVDGRYRLWLNGEAVGRGPVRATPHFQRVDAYERALRGGDNLLAVLIHVPGVDLAWYETMQGGWQPVFGDGGLFAEIRQRGELVPVAWRLVEADAWRRDTPRGGWGQDFLEDFDARRLDPAWLDPGFDDSAWPAARAMISLGSDAERARGFGRVEPFPVLLPSEIPPPREQCVMPSRLLWARSVEPRPDLPLDRRLYEEAAGAEAAALVDDPGAILRDDDEATIVRTSGDGATALLLAFDPLRAGHPFIELEAVGGEIVEVAVAESLPGEFGIGDQAQGLRHEGHLGVAHLFRYTARPGLQRFEKFGWAAVRAMQIVVRGAPDGIALRRVGAIATHYPAEPLGSFACSDDVLVRLWQVARHTVGECMHDSWVDCPGREARQWVGDAIVQFDVAALGFGPSVFPLQRQFLRQASESQRADGLVRMFAPGDIAADALVIPDFSLLWMIGAERYYRQSGDLDTVEAILPAIERSLAWFERHRDAFGLLADLPHWHFIEWADLGRAGQSAPVNALYAGALAAVAVLADALERPRLAARCGDARARILASLAARHWNEARGVYVDSVDPLTGRQGRRVSQHANALLLLYGEVDEVRRARMLAAITDDSRLRLTAAPPIVPDAPPFDEATDIVRANSFFLHFVHDGIASTSGLEWVLDDLRRLYRPMLDAGTTTLWESFSPSASKCHGFSATPLYQLSRHCLGVTPEAPGYARFGFGPDPGGLDWASGSVPTPAGPIEVEWSLADRRLTARVRHPSTCELVVRPPAGLTLASRHDTADGCALVFDPAEARA